MLESRAQLRSRHSLSVMRDDRDHRPLTAPADWDNAKSASAADDDVGCAFWAAMLAVGLVVLLAGYGLAALSDRVAGALLAVLP